MKLTMLIGLIVIVLLCVVGFTQNEFITEIDLAVSSQIDAGMVADVITGDANDLDFEIVREGILQNTATVYFYTNDGNLLNSFNIILGTDKYVLSRTVRTQDYKDQLVYSTNVSNYDETLRIDTSSGITIGADNLKYPISISSGIYGESVNRPDESVLRQGLGAILKCPTQSVNLA